jgi:hypothetical protein
MEPPYRTSHGGVDRLTAVRRVDRARVLSPVIDRAATARSSLTVPLHSPAPPVCSLGYLRFHETILHVESLCGGRSSLAVCRCGPSARTSRVGRIRTVTRSGSATSTWLLMLRGGVRRTALVTSDASPMPHGRMARSSCRRRRQSPKASTTGLLQRCLMQQRASSIRSALM